MAIHQTDPGSLPRQPAGEPAEKARGRLRIYFSYAAGAGKTRAMLEAAAEARKNGADAVAGFVGPAGRPDAGALLSGLEALRPLELPGPGGTRKEFDLDGALRRKPRLILLDDLAHANAPGCRHEKRYQDAEELLRAGIDVYTTLNVENIESLNDVVSAITGFSAWERVPDSVFDGADQIELVDREPDDLVRRFQSGTLFPGGPERPGFRNIYTKETLTALRAAAWRRAADKTGRAGLRGRGPAKDKPADPGEHILVCLSSAPSNARVVRAAARLAEAFHGAFTALFVETPGTRELGDKYRPALRKNLKLAEQLGAQVMTMYGEEVPEQIAEYARVSRVSKIVMGRSDRRKRWFARANLVDKLIALAPNLDIYIIPDTQPSASVRVPKFSGPPRFSAADAAKSAGILALCTLVAVCFSSLGFHEADIVTIYILGVLLDAMVTGSWVYGAVSSVLGVLVFDFIFITPRLSLRAYAAGYPVTFLVMLFASLVTSTLTERVKRQAKQSARKAYRTEVLLETSRKLQQAKDEGEILSETARQMVKLLDRTVLFYPVKNSGLADPMVFPKSGAADPKVFLGADERAAAEWVYKNNKRAGATTGTLSAARCLYLAVRGSSRVLAVAAVVMDRKAPLEAFEQSLTVSMLGECALALEKERLDESQKRMSVQIQQEKLRTNLLRTISHDLRTPLTSISGNAGILLKNSKVLDETQKRSIYSDIYDDSMWLIDLVENLLSITRIEDGRLRLNLQPELLGDVIAEALRHISRNSAEHRIETSLSDEFLMAKMDSRLIVQVVVNLVNNAIKYTQPGSVIAVTAERDRRFARVEVADDGPGVPDEAKSRLFDMFYTAGNSRGDGRRGLGLGLYLCRSIVHAHGGTIYVRDNVPKGTVFGFTLEAAEVNLHE